MAVLKCKMCAGNIQVADGATLGTCESCGSTSTLPKASDERKANLFNRANHFRRQNDFDKSMQAYENILNEDSAEAEAHWGIVLSRYGIEYVEDPVLRRPIPTCHRVQSESILNDADYLAALEHAPDESARSKYKDDAKEISEVQKGILAISSKEQPYDVFICYKETAEDGSRTKDSALAQDLYYQLEKEGHKVFFSRISLESKLGQQYEPYIFNALNSAKVMLVIGTKPEYFNAVWVKNEWSRFLALMKKDRSRLLIPCYRDMDAYDLPEEMAMLQSQDMGRIGFMQDIAHGIKKVAGSAKSDIAKGSSAAPSSAEPGVESLMKRGFFALKNSEWNEANGFFDRVLDINAEYTPAHVGMLCAELGVKSEADLANCGEPFGHNKNYLNALSCANAEYRIKLEGYNQAIENRIAKTMYDQLVEDKNRASTEGEYQNLARRFRDMNGYADTEALADECEAMALKVQYDWLVQARNKASTEKQYQDLARQFRGMNGYADTEALADECEAMAKKCYIISSEKQKRQQYERLVQVKNNASTEEECQNLAGQFRNMKGYANTAELAIECDNKYHALKQSREERERVLEAERIEKERIEKERQAEEHKKYKEEQERKRKAEKAKKLFLMFLCSIPPLLANILTWVLLHEYYADDVWSTGGVMIPGIGITFVPFIILHFVGRDNDNGFLVVIKRISIIVIVIMIISSMILIADPRGIGGTGWIIVLVMTLAFILGLVKPLRNIWEE